MAIVGKGKNKVHFPYTKEGIDDAKSFAKKTNQDVRYMNNGNYAKSDNTRVNTNTNRVNDAKLRRDVAFASRSVLDPGYSRFKATLDSQKRDYVTRRKLGTLNDPKYTRQRTLANLANPDKQPLQDAWKAGFSGRPQNSKTGTQMPGFKNKKIKDLI